MISTRNIQLGIGALSALIYISTMKTDIKNAASNEQSKFKAWSQNFKSKFVEECSKDVDADKKQKFEVVCQCFAERLEQQHVLPTEFNSILSTETEFAQDFSNRIRNYFSTDSGKETKEVCANLVK
jgi:hypothetical protein